MSSTRRFQGGLDVIRTIAAIATSLYGTTERYKCVTERGTSVHLNCVAHILQNLHIQHPVGHLVNDLVQSHHDTYGCGTKTLLMMLDLLTVAAMTLKHKGLDEVTIAHGLMQAVELAITGLPTLPLSSVFNTGDCAHVEHTQDVASASQDDDDDISTTPQQGVDEEVWPEVSLDMPQTDNTDQIKADMIKSSLPSSVAAKDTDIAVHGVQFLQLEMKLKDDAEQDDFDDDVSWFFEDGKVPSDDRMDESLQELLSRAADLLGGADEESQGLATEKILPMLEINPSEHKASPCAAPGQPTALSFSSLQHNGDEDEFDSCFDVSPKSQPCPASSQSTLSKEESNLQLKDELDDEFDSCFDDVIYEATDKNSKLIQPKDLSAEYQGFLKKILPSGQLKIALSEERDSDRIIDAGLEKKERETLEDQFEQVSLEHGKHDATIERQHLDLNEKLKEIMKKKSTSLTANICNQSRHFKMMETTIHDMSSDTPDEKEPSLTVSGVEPSSIEVMNAKLEAIMKSKKTLAQEVVLNRSRHYRDIDSSVLEMSAKNIKDSATDPEIDLQDRTVPMAMQNLTEAGAKDISNADRFGAIDTLATHWKLNSVLTSEVSIPVVCRGSRYLRTTVDSTYDTDGDSQNNAQTQCSFSSNHIPAGNQQHTCDTTKLRTLEISSQVTNTVRSAIAPPTVDTAYVTDMKLKSLVLGLSRGEEQIAQMVYTAAWQQQGQAGAAREAVPLAEFRFEVPCLHTVTLVGVSSMKSEVVAGLVISASLDDLELLQHQTKRRALLINGDISPNFQHRGMNNKPDTVLVRKQVPTMSREERWLQNITHRLEKFSVSALLVKGNVTAEVIDYCHARGIVVLSHVPTKALLAIAETTQSSMASYVAECTEDNIAEDVNIKSWSPDWTDQVTCLRHTAYALVTTPADVVQTAVMCHPCADVAEMMEEKFMHTACRLRNAISSTQVIEGGFEELIAQRLNTVAQELQVASSGSSMVPVIVEAVSEGFHSLSLVLQANSVIPGEFPSMLKHSPISPNTPNVPKEQRTDHSLENATDISVSSRNYSVSSEHFTGRKKDVAHNVEDHFSPANSGYSKCLYPEEFAHQVVDDSTSRVEAIRCAAHLVCQVLQMDYEVVTGLTGADMPQGDGIIGLL